MIDMEELIPKDYLSKLNKEKIYFYFIYRNANEHYSKIGCPSVNLACLIKKQI